MDYTTRNVYYYYYKFGPFLYSMLNCPVSHTIWCSGEEACTRCTAHVPCCIYSPFRPLFPSKFCSSILVLIIFQCVHSQINIHQKILCI